MLFLLLLLCRKCRIYILDSLTLRKEFLYYCVDICGKRSSPNTTTCSLLVGAALLFSLHVEDHYYDYVVLSKCGLCLCVFSGLLNPLDSPHHMRIDEESNFREGVVVDRPCKAGKGSFVNCGMRKVCVCYVVGLISF